MKKITKIANKPVKIFAETVDKDTLKQFENAMNHPAVVKGALMPDAHKGYSLPIGGVVSSRDVVFPAFVGYDIGCGMSAINLKIKKDEINDFKEKIFSSIYRSIPTGFYHNKIKQDWDYSKINRTEFLDQIMKKRGLFDLCSLGGGNHFIEISYDENDDIWIVVHSGSRNVGHTVATRYMKIAAAGGDIDNFSKFKAKEGAFGLSVNSRAGKNYIIDLNFCLEFALENRKRIIEKVAKEIFFYVLKKKKFEINETFINKNHNHAELKNGFWIHRKGATHAEKGMWGVIPGNMRDGSFVVLGKGNEESLNSSSHGAGRVLSRAKAKKEIKMDKFHEAMKGVVAKVSESTKDESPFAYKDIFEVMKLQKDLVEVKHHLKPLINIKG